MTISCVVRYRENVLLLVVFTSVSFLFMSGISWPASNIPAFWKAVGSLIPSTFGIKGFLKISSMGATIQDMAEEYKALWIQTVCYFFTACMVYRAQIIAARKHAIERLELLKKKFGAE